MTTDRWAVDPAAVALDLLDDDERALAARLVADDPAFGAEVARLRATTTTLGALKETAWALAVPPSLTHAAPEPELAGRRPEPPAAGRRWGGGGRGAGTALAAAAACVAIALVAVIRSGSRDDVAAPSPTTVALRPLPGVSGRAELKLNGAGTEAELRGVGLRPTGPHDYYEAWLADARGHMVSMGTFRVRPDGRVDVQMPVAVDVSLYTLVDISLEPDDGNPAHSKTSVLRARL